MNLHSVQFRLIVTGKIQSKNIVIQLISFFCSLFLIFLFDYHVGYLWFFNNFFSFFIEIRKEYLFYFKCFLMIINLRFTLIHQINNWVNSPLLDNPIIGHFHLRILIYLKCLNSEIHVIK